MIKFNLSIYALIITSTLFIFSCTAETQEQINTANEIRKTLCDSLELVKADIPEIEEAKLLCKQGVKIEEIVNVCGPRLEELINQQ